MVLVWPLITAWETWELALNRTKISTSTLKKSADCFLSPVMSPKWIPPHNLSFSLFLFLSFWPRTPTAKSENLCLWACFYMFLSVQIEFVSLSPLLAHVELLGFLFKNALKWLCCIYTVEIKPNRPNARVWKKQKTHILLSFRLIILFMAANFLVFCFPWIKQFKGRNNIYQTTNFKQNSKTKIQQQQKQGMNRELNQEQRCKRDWKLFSRSGT